MAAAFGVHVGTTCATVAVYKDGKTNVVANDLGERVTPCIVAFTEHDQTVGAAAKQGIVRNAANTICHVTEIIGHAFSDPEVVKYKESNAVTLNNKNGQLMFEVEFKGSKKSISPEDILTYIFKKLLETARSHGGSGSSDTVLSISTRFSQAQNNSISKCAKAAGFNVLRVITEPSAGVLAYDIAQADKKDECNILIFRLGGTSCNASVIEVQNGIYKLESSVTENTLCGDKFTSVLVSHLAEDFQRKNRCNLGENKRALSKLRIAAEMCKHSMSKQPNAHCNVESLYEGIDLQSNVSRARYESLCQNLVQQCLTPIEEALTKASMKKGNIDKVILCGGGTRIPQVQNFIKGHFSGADILCHIPTEEVLAVGAAKQAALLMGKSLEDVTSNTESNIVDCLSKHLCIKKKIESEDGSSVELFPIFHKHTPVPCRYQESFTLADDQTAIKVELLECDDLDKPDGTNVAKIVMKDLAAGGLVTLVFHLRKDCSLHVTCTEESSQRVESAIIDIS